MPGLSLQKGSSSSEEPIENLAAGTDLFRAIGSFLTNEAGEIASNKPMENADTIIEDLKKIIGKYTK